MVVAKPMCVYLTTAMPPIVLPGVACRMALVFQAPILRLVVPVVHLARFVRKDTARKIVAYSMNYVVRLIAPVVVIPTDCVELAPSRQHAVVMGKNVLIAETKRVRLANA